MGARAKKQTFSTFFLGRYGLSLSISCPGFTSDCRLWLSKCNKRAQSRFLLTKFSHFFIESWTLPENTGVRVRS